MKVALLEYLDKLEATAREAPGMGDLSQPDGSPWVGDWERAGRIVAKYTEDMVVMVAEKASPRGTAHIVATQPRATLALIAKLREAVDLVRQATAIAAYPGVGASPINRFQDDVIAWASIEVPE